MESHLQEVALRLLAELVREPKDGRPDDATAMSVHIDVVECRFCVDDPFR